MSVRLRHLVFTAMGALGLLLILAGCTQFSGLQDLQGDQTPASPGGSAGVVGFGVGAGNAPVCPGAEGDASRCHSRVVIDRDGKPLASSSPQGYSPAQIRHAYGFDTLSANGSGITIGIVDAYDDPTIVNDLAAFKSQFGISGCNLTKVNQNGGTKYPRVNSGWALEISLDVEWACAIAPGANILLVEASSNSNTNLYAAWIMRLSTPRWSP